MKNTWVFGQGVAAGLAAFVFFGVPAAAQRTAPVQFRPHDIAQFPGAYAVAVADFNNDGRLDVMANKWPRLGATEVAWHENPTWERHVIVTDVSGVPNQAIMDIDGDGIPEVAFQSGFALPSSSPEQRANSEGLNWIARSQGDPRGQWKAEVIDRWETSHDIAWADLDGDGELELVNAPYIGAGRLAPTYDQDFSSVFWYGQQDGWRRHIVADADIGVTSRLSPDGHKPSSRDAAGPHRVRAVKWDGDNRDAILVVSYEGIALYRAVGSGANMTFRKDLISPGRVEAAPAKTVAEDQPAPRSGTSDVGVGASGTSRIVASIEPWHGNEVVVYTDTGGEWKRRVIYDEITSGHEIVVLDLNGDGRADIVANDNSRNPNGTPGVHVFFSPEDPATGEWIYSRIESEAGMNSCVGGDVNNDGRPDVICTGGGNVIRWYENLGL